MPALNGCSSPVRLRVPSGKISTGRPASRTARANRRPLIMFSVRSNGITLRKVWKNQPLSRRLKK
jgi:hypothetical protein